MTVRVDFTPSQREYWVNFLLARDGYCCVGCNRDITTLVRESKPDRVLPVVIVDHIDGDTRFTDSRSGVHGGNLRLLCYSCNRKNIKKTRPLLPERERSPEQKKSDEFKPVFYNWLSAFLVDQKHICYKKMLNRGSKLAGDSSQVTAKRWYDQMFDAVDGYEEFDLFGTGLECNYGKCDGTHVCLFGEVPRPKEVYKEMVEHEVGYSPDTKFK